MSNAFWTSSTQHVVADTCAESRQRDLSTSYTPGPTDVICGKGHKSFNHSGNQTLRRLIASKVPDYSKAGSRWGKSQVVSAVIKAIHSSGGSFVRQDDKTGAWYKISNSAMREKVSSRFRDHLAPMYQSSAKRKNALRAAKSREKRLVQPARLSRTLKSSAARLEDDDIQPVMSLSSMLGDAEPASTSHRLVQSLAESLTPFSTSTSETLDSATLNLFQDVFLQPTNLRSQYSISGTTIDEVNREPDGGVEGLDDDTPPAARRTDPSPSVIDDFCTMKEFGNFRFSDPLE